MLTGSRYGRLWWIRLFGYGLMVKDLRQHPMLFSERDGRVWGLRIGCYYVRLLPKCNPWHPYMHTTMQTDPDEFIRLMRQAMASVHGIRFTPPLEAP